MLRKSCVCIVIFRVNVKNAKRIRICPRMTLFAPLSFLHAKREQNQLAFFSGKTKCPLTSILHVPLYAISSTQEPITHFPDVPVSGRKKVMLFAHRIRSTYPIQTRGVGFRLAALFFLFSIKLPLLTTYTHTCSVHLSHIILSPFP